ncbi:hypothetical protein [Niallia taxi]
MESFTEKMIDKKSLILVYPATIGLLRINNGMGLLEIQGKCKPYKSYQS